MRQPTPWFHGSSETLATGQTLTPSADGFVYVARSPRWADAFAFRDAASHALHQAMVDIISTRTLPDLAALRVNGTIYTVAAAGTCEPDPDFLTAPDSARTRGPVTVESSTPGAIASWREFTAIVGPHKMAYKAVPFYDDHGYIIPLQKWLQWGYTAAQFRRLGRWFPTQGLWQVAQRRTLLVTSELALPIIEAPPEIFVPRVRALRAGAPLSDEAAAYAARTWWL